jgi:hypothetical protein
MIDPAQHLIDLQRYARETEELLAYATPTPGQRSKIMANALSMSVLAMRIMLWYDEAPKLMKPAPKQWPGQCGC